MENLSQHHWNAITWIMRSAVMCFETINDHQVISQIHHAKKQVPFKTMTTPSSVGGSTFRFMALWQSGVMSFSHVAQTKTSP
jgi:hypothetical protein